MTEREAHLRAAWMFEFWLRKHQDNPSEQTFWQTALFEKLWQKSPRAFKADGAPAMGKITGAQVGERMAAQGLEAWCLKEADEVLALHDLIVDEESRLKLAKAIAAAVQRASIALQQQARGEFAASPTQGADGGKGTSLSHSEHFPPVELAGLFEEWAAERQPAAKTRYEWRRVIGELERFLGHKDAARITANDLIGWKSRLVEDGCRPKTIRDAKLAPVRAVLQWGVNNQRLTSNAAAGVTIELKSRAGEGRRSFTDAEAELVLKAAEEQTDPVLRWVPWLCAYTGGRISEVSQLRKNDVVELDGIWCIKFDPAAGPLKNRGSERLVPIHSALLEAGFLGFVEEIAEGPLFPGLPVDKFGKRGGNGTKLLGRWVRRLGLTDMRLSPSHSWRHRFKTSARRYGLATDIVDAIAGHAHRSVGDSYGEFPIEALKRELEKLPNVLLGKPNDATTGDAPSLAAN